ncbi:diguanylate cyclase [Acidimicrobiaceae bacterium USS-CC1]|uniref:Diguanylate cyclase n=1 Tax=Acidiferrimicrobium australe TaxID=2664430 RepID=A0ABW9QP37_9ACTN|nr:diguanylate cyclase [Acidiferrimicrobium australe]
MAQAVVEPDGPEQPAPPAASTPATALARSFFSRPSRVAAFLWSAGALAVALVLPLHRWSGPALLGLGVSAAVAACCAGARATVGGRLPRWSVQVDVALGNLLVTVIAAAGASKHTNMANLYLLVEVFALLYLPLRSALVHLGAAGAAYAVVLGLGPRTAEPPAVAWLAVFGTAAVLGAVLVGLVGVLRNIAREDPLTGLANRRSWDEQLQTELERSARSGSALSVVVLDLDGFKAVNDVHGHQAGDRLLQAVARSGQAATRGGGDLLARLGGDEFAVLAPGSDEIGAHRLARRLTEQLPRGVSASVGVATWDRAEGASDLLRRADQALYQAKRRRR